MKLTNIPPDEHREIKELVEDTIGGIQRRRRVARLNIRTVYNRADTPNPNNRGPVQCSRTFNQKSQHVFASYRGQYPLKRNDEHL